MKIQHAPYFLVAVAIIIIARPTPTLAAQTSTGTVETPSQVVADVSIRQARIETLIGNTMTVDFSLTNGGSAQPDVRYGLEIIQADKNGNELSVDEDISAEVLSLSQGQTLQRSITYTPPGFFSGTYQVWVVSQTSSGLPLSTGLAGVATFTPTIQSNYADILLPTCYLTVSDDSQHVHYTPQQGVDILPSETLNATCQVESYFTSTQSLYPSFETHYRTQYGAIVPTNPVPTQEASFTKGETKTVTFALPNAQTSQAYDVKMVLVDVSGHTVSNPEYFHYVLHGNSATIQTASLDKDQYARGDIAHISVGITPSADSFSGSRLGSSASTTLSLSASLVNGFGSSCAAPITQEVSPSQFESVSLQMPITATCMNPSLSVSLKDSSGNILDQRTFSVKTNVARSPWSMIMETLWITLGILILMLALFFFVKRLYGRPPQVGRVQ